MNRLLLTVESYRSPRGMDVAVSHAILRAVSNGLLEGVMRLHVPSPVVAFGRADRVSRGYQDAVRAAETHGFTAVERLAGGRAAVFHESTLAFSWVVPLLEPRVDIQERFDLTARLMTDAFRSLGIDARVGEVPGEYCPGAWSVNVGGITKVMGVGQRLVRGAAHVGGVVVVNEADRIREVLIPVYEALGIDWNPDTVGALAVGRPGLTTGTVAAAIIESFGTRFDLEEGSLPSFISERALTLLPDHLPRVA